MLSICTKYARFYFFLSLKVTFGTKYDDTIYYLFPFYNRIFPQLSRLLVVDADTEFHMDPADLTDHFDLFGTGAVTAWAMHLLSALYKLMPGCFLQ